VARNAMQVMSTDFDLPTKAIEWVGPIAAIVGAAWAVYTFRQNTKAKHAEIFLNLESNYRKHIPTMLKVEYTREYKQTFEPALAKANDWTNQQSQAVAYTKAQNRAIDELELTLRHFLLAEHLRSLGVARRAIDSSHRYYLRRFIEPGREELRKYMSFYWPTVLLWAQLAGEPFYARLWIYTTQIPARLRYWHRGARFAPALTGETETMPINSPLADPPAQPQPAALRS